MHLTFTGGGGPPLWATLLVVIVGGLVTYLVTRLVEVSKRFTERDRTLVHLIAELTTLRRHYERSILALTDLVQLPPWQAKLRLLSAKYYGNEFGSFELSNLSNLDSNDAAEIARVRLNVRNADIHIDRALEIIEAGGDGAVTTLAVVLEQLLGRLRQIVQRGAELEGLMAYARPKTVVGLHICPRHGGRPQNPTDFE